MLGKLTKTIAHLLLIGASVCLSCFGQQVAAVYFFFTFLSPRFLLVNITLYSYSWSEGYLVISLYLTKTFFILHFFILSLLTLTIRSCWIDVHFFFSFAPLFSARFLEAATWVKVFKTPNPLHSFHVATQIIILTKRNVFHLGSCWRPHGCTWLEVSEQTSELSGLLKASAKKAK